MGVEARSASARLQGAQLTPLGFPSAPSPRRRGKGGSVVGPKEAHPPSKPRQRQLVLKRRLGGVRPAPFFRKVFRVRQAGGSPSLPFPSPPLQRHRSGLLGTATQNTQRCLAPTGGCSEHLTHNRRERSIGSGAETRLCRAASLLASLPSPGGTSESRRWKAGPVSRQFIEEGPRT